MIRFRYSLAQLFFTFAVLLTVATGTATWAQDEFDDDWEEVEEVVVVQAQPAFIARAENFDQWVFPQSTHPTNRVPVNFAARLYWLHAESLEINQYWRQALPFQQVLVDPAMKT